MLVMEIWTDGSISPKDALIESAKILKNSLSIFTGVTPEEPAQEKEADKEKLRDRKSVV